MLDRSGSQAHLIGVAVALSALLGACLVALDWRVVVVAVALIGTILVTFRFPFVGVLVYLWIALIRPEELRFAPVFFHLQLLFALVCVAALALPSLLKRRVDPWPWLGTDKAVALLFATACASIPLAVSRPTALAACWHLSKLLFAYALIRHTATSPARVQAVLWVMVLATITTAGLAQRGWSTGRVYVGEAGVVRIAGLTSAAGDPNALANTLIDTLPFMVLLASVEPSLFRKAILVAMTGFCLYVTSLTGARAGIVSLGIVIVLLVLSARRRLVSLLVFGSVLLLLWVNLPPGLSDRYLTLGRYGSEVTYRGRVETAKVGFQMLRDHPLAGIGLGCFQIARVEEYDGIWVQPHNVYAQVAAEMGALGLSAFGLFLVSLGVVCARTRRMLTSTGLDRNTRTQIDRLCVAIIIMLVALLVQGLAGHNLARWHYYFGAAVATSCLQIVSAAVPARRSPPARGARGRMSREGRV